MAEKTEKPTQKKLDDGAKKGKILKSRDVIVSAIMLFGIVFLVFYFSLRPMTDLLYEAISSDFDLNTLEYTRTVFLSALRIIAPLLLGVMLVTVLISLSYSKFKIAKDAIRFNLDAINPVNGFKRLFSWRTLKDFIKAILYFSLFTTAVWVFWTDNKKLFFLTLNAEINILIVTWSKIFFKLTIYCIVSILGVVILDLITEYFLFMKDMKMEKEEVKREYKDQEGNPEVKSKRRELHRELLSEQLMSDIDNSRLIIANPSHIAIGIYFKPEISPILLISVRETNQVALAVRLYAEKRGIPVVRDIVLARKLYATHKRYDCVNFDELEKILNLIFWLEEVERTNRPEISADMQSLLENNEVQIPSESTSNAGDGKDKV